MDSSSAETDIVETLTRREDVISVLESGPTRKGTLVTELECARSTVDRAVRELEGLDLVERNNGQFLLTSAGRLAIDEYRRCHRSLSAIGDVGHILREVPADAPMSTAILEGATINEPEPHAPNRPFEELTSLLEDAVSFRGFAAVERIPQIRDRLHERTVRGELDAEILFTEELVSFLLTAYPQQAADVMETGNFEIYSIAAVPYELGIVETPTCSRVFLTITTANEELHAILSNDTGEALEWAETVYRRYRAVATPLEPME